MMMMDVCHSDIYVITMAIDLTSFQSPGVYIVEQEAGYIPSSFADHGHVYLLGSSTTGDYNTPTQVTSVTDFTNVFGESPSTDAVSLYFQNDPRGILWFVRIEAVDDANPTQIEYTDALNVTTFNDTLSQGILICPQAFMLLTTVGEKEAVALAMRDVASDALNQWLAVIDGSVSATDTTSLQTEFQNITSSRGHVAVYAPWVVTFDDVQHPPSPVMAGIISKNVRTRGFYTAPAGRLYPLRGVKSLVRKFTRAEQDVVNPLGINLLMYRKGLIVPWGARTRSASEYFNFIHHRLIFNVVNRTIRDNFDGFVFETTGRRNITLREIKQSADAILFRLWSAGALYGAEPADSFECICDETNNSALDLDNGNVRLDVYAIPIPIVEKLVTKLVRIPIGHFILDGEGNVDSFIQNI